MQYIVKIPSTEYRIRLYINRTKLIYLINICISFTGLIITWIYVVGSEFKSEDPTKYIFNAFNFCFITLFMYTVYALI